MPSMSFAASDRVPRSAASKRPSSGRKRRIAPEEAVLGHGVRVLVRVRHAGVEGHAPRSARVPRGRWSQTSAIRSWVVHMKVVTPSS